MNVEKIKNIIATLPKGSGHCAIFRDEVYKQHPSVVLSAKKLKDLSNDHTRLEREVNSLRAKNKIARNYLIQIEQENYLGSASTLAAKAQMEMNGADLPKKAD